MSLHLLGGCILPYVSNSMMDWLTSHEWLFLLDTDTIIGGELWIVRYSQPCAQAALLHPSGSF